MAARKRLAVKLTQEWIKRAETPKDRQEWFDTETKGLTLRIGISGTKTFYLFAKIHGRLTRMKLGTFPDMPIAQARSEVARIRGDVAKGQTPKPRATVARDELTLEDLFAWYLRTHAKPHKRTWKDDESRFKRVLLHWSNRKLSTITTELVKDLHVEIDEKYGPYAANKMLELLGFMWRLGAKQLKFSTPDPTSGILRFPKQSRKRYLTRAEIPRFLDALARLPSETQTQQTTVDCILMSLLTGARRSNVSAMRWEDVDMSERIWSIPAAQSKNTLPLRVILSSPAIAILERRAESKSSPWVFPGPGKRGHINEPKHALKAACDLAGIDNLRFHDLRRTLGSWQAQQGTSLQIIGKSLGHESLRSTQIYAQLADDPVRESVEFATVDMISTPKKIEKKS